MRKLLLPLILFLLPGCQLGYLWKQCLQQLEMSRMQVPLTSMDLSRTLPEDKQEKLYWVPAVLEFASQELRLDPGDSYETFLDTGGEPVSHAVVAAHPEALISYRWCFPFVGCVPYKGYFDESDAREEADRLRGEGWDVVVLPVGAYSSLGWFRDPVTSVMLERELPEFVELLLHETVHRTLYVKGMTTFNESLATHVAREGTRAFFEKHPEAADAEALDGYRQNVERSIVDEEILQRLCWDLETLYRSPLSSDVKLRRKTELFATAAAARRHVHGYTVEMPTSNAYALASLRYHQLLPALARLQAEQGGHPRDLMAYLTDALEGNGTLPEELVLNR